MDAEGNDRSSPSTDRSAGTTVLYFVRHGETEYNRKGIMQGSGVDSSLNRTGREQAHALRRRFSSLPVDVVYSSDLRRAQETADLLAESLPRADRRILSDLREISWGVLEGESPSPTRDAALGTVKSQWAEGNYDARIDGGESILDVRDRAIRAAQHMVEMDASRTILAVTHGRYLRVLLASICDGYDLADMSALGHDNTCVNRLLYRDGRFHADVLNCTTHLDPEASRVPHP
jgi:broad specificity phosphatase PhoE